jgi:thiol-disulfide isomerase/thioredoxin
MKNLFLSFLAIAIASCSNAPKDYVTLSGKITNKISDSVVVRTRSYSKIIKVTEDGTFSDTLKVVSGIYNFYDGGESTSIFLKNGYDLNITLDTKQFDETISYSGNGAESNNFIAGYSLLREELLNQDFLDLDKEAFYNLFTEIETKLTTKIESSFGVDTLVSNFNLREIEPMLSSYKSYFGGVISLKSELNGKDSPIFEDYKNYDGSKTSLSDLQGKYVYVDVWATWCGPCKAEIPSLKKVEKKYHGKNIAFVSLSIDDDKSHGGSWEKADEDWRAMVANKELGGIQLFAPKGWQSEFVKEYKIKGIPRFILIGPDGKIIDASAPRPSDEKLIKLFKSHNI